MRPTLDITALFLLAGQALGLGSLVQIKSEDYKNLWYEPRNANLKAPRHYHSALGSSHDPGDNWSELGLIQAKSKYHPDTWKDKMFNKGEPVDYDHRRSTTSVYASAEEHAMQLVITRGSRLPWAQEVVLGWNAYKHMVQNFKGDENTMETSEMDSSDLSFISFWSLLGYSGKFYSALEEKGRTVEYSKGHFQKAYTFRESEGREEWEEIQKVVDMRDWQLLAEQPSWGRDRPLESVTFSVEYSKHGPTLKQRFFTDRGYVVLGYKGD